LYHYRRSESYNIVVDTLPGAVQRRDRAPDPAWVTGESDAAPAADPAVDTARVDRQAQAERLERGFLGAPDRGDQHITRIGRGSTHVSDFAEREVIFDELPVTRFDVLDIDADDAVFDKRAHRPIA
jgi:hypothetical protein